MVKGVRGIMCACVCVYEREGGRVTAMKYVSVFNTFCVNLFFGILFCLVPMAIFQPFIGCTSVQTIFSSFVSIYMNVKLYWIWEALTLDNSHDDGTQTHQTLHTIQIHIDIFGSAIWHSHTIRLVQFDSAVSTVAYTHRHHTSNTEHIRV